MRDALEELKEVHKQQQATVPGHWTEQCVGRAVTELEHLREVIRTAASWMIPFDVMDEDDRAKFDRAKAEVDGVLLSLGQSVNQKGLET